jgi:hypothetical protein
MAGRVMWLSGDSGRIPMKLMSSLSLGLILAPLAMMAQAPAKSGNRTAATSEPTTTSDREKNIQAYIKLMRSDLRKQKAQVMSTVMQLDSDESAKFWPIYKDFEADLTQFYDQVGALVKNYVTHNEDLTDAAADQLATKVLDLEQQRNDIKRRYYDRFKTALDSIVAMRFLQVENQIERVIDLQIASELPIAERKQP